MEKLYKRGHVRGQHIGDWEVYLDYVNDRLEHTLMCESCEQPYDERYGCVYGGLDDMELSYA